jgi:vitamin B12 transporter
MSMTGVSAHAATSEAANGEAEATLPSLTFTTTATKTPTLVKNTIAQTTVIDEEQLQRYRGQSVLDVLRGKAGFYIKQNGGDGTLSNFSIRGLSAKNVAVLIDGIRYTSLSNGYAELALLPADQIDRIEVLYGASGSSLYGADATAGVIQIFLNIK